MPALEGVWAGALPALESLRASFADAIMRPRAPGTTSCGLESPDARAREAFVSSRSAVAVRRRNRCAREVGECARAAGLRIATGHPFKVEA